MLVIEQQLRNYPYQTRQGLSEKLVQNHFTKKGYEVFRSTMLMGKEWSVNYYRYEAVQNKYEKLEMIIHTQLKDKHKILKRYLKTHSGLPDFFIYKNTRPNPIMFFAEVKLEHEQLRPNQLRCIKFLETLGFQVCLIRLKKRIWRTKTEIAKDQPIEEYPVLKTRVIVAKQEKLTKKYLKKCKKRNATI